MQRRCVLKAGLTLIATATAAAVYRPAGAATRVLLGGAKWHATETPPPVVVRDSGRVFLTEYEAAQVKAIYDRLIPADELSVSASQAGCVVFIDHQLAGSYGRGEWRYTLGPYRTGSAAQGDQSPLTPAACYRQGLAQIDAYCRRAYGKPFDALTSAAQDAFLERMEAGKVALASMPGAALFAQFLANVQEGFLADPVYGGNRDMAGWKMIGFPGARYDYRDYVQSKGQKLDIEPVGLAGRI